MDAWQLLKSTVLLSNIFTALTLTMLLHMSNALELSFQSTFC